MPPLNRQDSRPSIYSWWSDSNPLLHGPTINLHVAAKPLMRLMYHRQALNIIRQNRCSPLSTTILETYSSYFPWDYVLLSTKTAILSELANRTLSSGVEAPEVEARAVADSPVLLYIVQMLVWPEPAARIWSCRLLGNLASHESAVPAVLDAQPCERLLCLLRDSDSLVVDMAIDALSEIAQQKDGAQAIGNTKDLIMILESPRSGVRKWACEVVARLASDKSIAPAILEAKLCVTLVALLSDTDSGVIRWAILALFQIAQWSRGAKAIVNAEALDRVLSLLESENPDIRGWACKIVGRLATHERTAPAVLEPKPCATLVSLLCDEAPTVIGAATSALSQIAQWRGGPETLVDAKALDYILALLKSQVVGFRGWVVGTRGCAWQIVESLARHDPTAPAILGLKLSLQVASTSIRHEDSRDAAISALDAICAWRDGVVALADMDGDVLEKLKQLRDDKSVGDKTRQQTRNVVNQIEGFKAREEVFWPGDGLK